MRRYLSLRSALVSSTFEETHSFLNKTFLSRLVRFSRPITFLGAKKKLSGDKKIIRPSKLGRPREMSSIEEIRRLTSASATRPETIYTPTAKRLDLRSDLQSRTAGNDGGEFQEQFFSFRNALSPFFQNNSLFIN